MMLGITSSEGLGRLLYFDHIGSGQVASEEVTGTTFFNNEHYREAECLFSVRHKFFLICAKKFFGTDRFSYEHRNHISVSFSTTIRQQLFGSKRFLFERMKNRMILISKNF